MRINHHHQPLLDCPFGEPSKRRVTVLAHRMNRDTALVGAMKVTRRVGLDGGLLVRHAGQTRENAAVRGILDLMALRAQAFQLLFKLS